MSTRKIELHKEDFWNLPPLEVEVKYSADSIEVVDYSSVDAYLAVLRVHIIDAVDNKVMDMQIDGEHINWVNEDKYNAACERADYLYEESKLRGM